MKKSGRLTVHFQCYIGESGTKLTCRSSHQWFYPRKVIQYCSKDGHLVPWTIYTDIEYARPHILALCTVYLARHGNRCSMRDAYNDGFRALERGGQHGPREEMVGSLQMTQCAFLGRDYYPRPPILSPYPCTNLHIAPPGCSFGWGLLLDWIFNPLTGGRLPGLTRNRPEMLSPGSGLFFSPREL